MNLAVLFASLAAQTTLCTDMEKLVLIEALNNDQTVRGVAVKDMKWSYGKVVTDNKTVLYFGIIKKQEETLIKAMRLGFAPDKPSEYDCSYEDGSSGVFYLFSKA